MNRSISFLMISILFFQACSLFETTHYQEFQVQQTKKSDQNVEKCSSGYSEIPKNLTKSYISQKISKDKETTPNPNEFPALKNENTFVGFVYSVEQEKNLNKKIKLEEICKAVEVTPQNVQFVEEKVNYVIRLYISAITENEQTISKIKGNLESEAVKNSKLCLEIRCGLYTFEGDLYSFNYQNIEDITWARAFADSNVSISAVNELRRLNESDLGGTYTDLEIQGFIIAARKIAIDKVNRTNSKK